MVSHLIKLDAGQGIAPVPNTNFLTNRKGAIGVRALLTSYFCSINELKAHEKIAHISVGNGGCGHCGHDQFYYGSYHL